MNAHMQRTAWTSAGLLLSLLAGSPAVADDTELMLLTPAASEDSKPNILFILDTSGSMAEEVMTQVPYDHTEEYPGDCVADNVYWTDVDVTPDCSDENNTQFVAKSAFVCDAANGQLMGIGSYSDTMVQHRETGVANVFRWQELQPGRNTDRVECQADSGLHGDGTNGTDLWASNGSDGSVFTGDPNREIAWGSAPAAVSYTVYDGNYLNWKQSPANAQVRKIDILKAVTKAVLNSISDVNVGVMRFNGNAGGPVIKAMSDLDADRQSILNTIDGLPATGNTPLSETMYEAALYWRGMNAHFGEQFKPSLTDPAALDATKPENYRQPETNVCSRNFNVLLTDGQPVQDLDTPGLVGNLPGIASTTCDGSGEGRCLDDIAAYLGTVDIDAAMDGDQFVTTHTIGFDIDLEIMRETAEDSDGTYFLADDVDSLALALLNIISDITERSLSFSAPAVSVNTFNRTQNLNDLYMTVFSSKTNVHWPGNLKKFTLAPDANGIMQIVDASGQPAVDPATGFFFDSPAYTAKSIWTDGDPDGNDVTLGGAAHELPLPASRNLYTNNGADNDLTAATNAVAPSNAANFSLADFGLTGATGEPSLDEMIRWMRGEDVRDEDFDPSTSVRNAMGDPLHSQPAAVVYGGNAGSPDVIVFAGTNDGYLHAIDGDTGEELWSFVPQELLRDMNRLFFDPRSNFKHYGIDGDIVPVVSDTDGDGAIESSDGDFVYLLFGLRRGGSSYYALDVTNRNAPQLLWMKEYPEFGQSWSAPVVTRVNIDAAEKIVAIVGGGYDPVHDTRTHPSSPDAQGAGIHMLDLETGDRLWRAGADSNADLDLDSMTRAIPTQVRVIDINGDRHADRMYASDLGGQIWRFDIANGETPANLVAGGVIAQLGAEGLGSPTDADTRRFYNSPDVAIFNDPFQGRRFISVSIGSGYRAHPLDNFAEDRFFSIRDPDVFNQLTQDEYDNYDVVTDADLAEVGNQIRVVIDSDDRGWKFTLPAEQKVIANSVTFNDSVFFVGFSPEASSAGACQPGNGRNFLYQVSIVNGDPVVNNLDTLAAEDADAERVTELAQGGIAAAPAFLFPGSTDPDCEGAECAEPPIACVGVECFDPGFVNNPVKTLWTQDGIE
jgi:type IV pilus assembly protein PilY1